MPFIQIITIPGTNQCAAHKYYFAGKTSDKNLKRWIGPGEVAEVPDSDVAYHLSSGKVMLVPDAVGVKARRGRPPKEDADFASVFAAQRG